VLSGPVAGKQGLLQALDRAGIAADEPHEAHGLPSHATPDVDHPEHDPTIGWVNARTSDINVAVKVAASSGWVLRSHWATPRCGVCGGNGQVNGPPDIGMMECTHCDGAGVTNVPPPSPEQEMAKVIARLERRIEQLEAGR